MAIKLIKQERCDAQRSLVNHYIIDSPADVADLPECCVGSTAIVASKDGPIYMVNASGEWKEQ